MLTYCLNLLCFGRTNEISGVFVCTNTRYILNFKLAQTYEDFQGVFNLGFVLLGFVIFYAKLTEGKACMC